MRDWAATVTTRGTERASMGCFALWNLAELHQMVFWCHVNKYCETAALPLRNKPSELSQEEKLWHWPLCGT